MDRIFTEAAKKIGADFSCHDLHTTGATRLADAHVDELVISILLGGMASMTWLVRDLRDRLTAAQCENEIPSTSFRQVSLLTSHLSRAYSPRGRKT
ncbi:MAG TPA: hypothetical protein VEK11_26255 [Thermoanaerobaculia bacterium]|nr:hypothetical protein [Thermoanaerobaculia bacterium]